MLIKSDHKVHPYDKERDDDDREKQPCDKKRYLNRNRKYQGNDPYNDDRGADEKSHDAHNEVDHEDRKEICNVEFSRPHVADPFPF